jgi:hypothetical protein
MRRTRIITMIVLCNLSFSHGHNPLPAGGMICSSLKSDADISQRIRLADGLFR